MVSKWQRTQSVGETQFTAVSDYTRRIWGDEQTFLNKHGRAPSLNVGSGACPVKCDVNIDPLLPSDVKAVGESLPLKDEVFGTVAVFSVLDHVLDDGQVLREAHRVLKRNGLFILMQSVLGLRGKIWLLRHRDMNHMRHYLWDWQLRRKLRRAGFVVNQWKIKWYNHDRVVYAVCSKQLLFGCE
jgi:SAM-dependent methyltransferase